MTNSIRSLASGDLSSKVLDKTNDLIKSGDKGSKKIIDSIKFIFEKQREALVKVDGLSNQLHKFHSEKKALGIGLVNDVKNLQHLKSGSEINERLITEATKTREFVSKFLDIKGRGRIDNEISQIMLPKKYHAKFIESSKSQEGLKSLEKELVTTISKLQTTRLELHGEIKKINHFVKESYAEKKQLDRQVTKLNEKLSKKEKAIENHQKLLRSKVEKLYLKVLDKEDIERIEEGSAKINIDSLAFNLKDIDTSIVVNNNKLEVKEADSLKADSIENSDIKSGGIIMKVKSFLSKLWLYLMNLLNSVRQNITV